MPAPAIALFAEKVKRLENSTLRAFMKNGWRWEYDFAENRPGDNARLPELDHLESYVLNLRFFLQDNEPSSIRNIAKLYETSHANTQAQKDFESIRSLFNNQLNNQIWFKYNNRTLTYHQLFDGMIYAKFAHSNTEAHPVLASLVSNPFGYMLALDSFLRCIDLVHNCLVLMRNLNNETFRDDA
jgi:hypothetical protein